MKAADFTTSFTFVEKLTDLIAVHGIYALVAVFLIYVQWLTFRNFTNASKEDRERLWRVYTESRLATYILIGIAIPVWLTTTYVFPPKTVLWGHVANLRQMTGEATKPGEVIVKQQIAPAQQDVMFYTSLNPDKADSSRTTFHWAIIEDGQYSSVPLVILHRYSELPSHKLTLDPNNPSENRPREIIQKGKFYVKMSKLAALKGRSYNYQYHEAKHDPDRTLGTIALLHESGEEVVPIVDTAQLPAPRLKQNLLAWLQPTSVFAQSNTAQQMAQAEKVLPYLGSRDLKQQLSAVQVLSDTGTVPWQEVYKTLENPSATEDHSMFVYNIAQLISAKQAKGLKVPGDVRLAVAKEAYKASDFATSAKLFNSLSDAEIKSDVTNYYFRGVSNLQTGNPKQASIDLSDYVSKAPNPQAKMIGQITLLRAAQSAATTAKKPAASIAIVNPKTKKQ